MKSKMTIRRIYSIFAATAFSVSTTQAAYIIAIDNTGANDPVNITNTRVWNFGITQAGADFFSTNGITFDAALFDAKRGSQTLEENPLVFTVYRGLGGAVNGNAVVATVSEPKSKFDNSYLGGDIFYWTPGSQLSTGYYSVTLSSTTPSGGNTEYFLKSGKVVLKDQNQVALDSSFWVQDQSLGTATAVFSGTTALPATPVPEPSQVALMLLGVGTVFFGLRRSGFNRQPAQ